MSLTQGRTVTVAPQPDSLELREQVPMKEEYYRGQRRCTHPITGLS